MLTRKIINVKRNTIGQIVVVSFVTRKEDIIIFFDLCACKKKKLIKFIIIPGGITNKKTTFILYYFFFTGSWLGASIKASKLYFKDYIYILIQYCTFIIYIQCIINT